MGVQTLKFHRRLTPGTHTHAGLYKNCHFKIEGQKFNQCILILPASLPDFLCWRSLLKNRKKNQDIVFQRKLQLSSNFRKASFLPLQISPPAWSRVWMWAPWGAKPWGSWPCPVLLPPDALTLMVISSSETLPFLMACALRGHPDKL